MPGVRWAGFLEERIGTVPREERVDTEDTGSGGQEVSGVSGLVLLGYRDTAGSVVGERLPGPTLEQRGWAVAG